VVGGRGFEPLTPSASRRSARLHYQRRWAFSQVSGYFGYQWMTPRAARLHAFRAMNAR
jgi:hypothetical protein